MKYHSFVSSRRDFTRHITIASMLLVAGGSMLQADVIPPVGLAPGTQFRLIFVSSQTRVSDDANVSVYDSFINTLADAAGLGVYNGAPVAWHVLGSTPAPLNAIDRLPNSSVPIYDMNGDLVANAANDIWSGALLHAIDFTEAGQPLSALVFTATLSTGLLDPTLQGFGEFGDQIVGNSSSSDSGWIDFGKSFNMTAHSFYGFSDMITVAAPPPSPVPEPSSVTLGLTAVALLGLACRGRCRPTC